MCDIEERVEQFKKHHLLSSDEPEFDALLRSIVGELLDMCSECVPKEAKIMQAFDWLLEADDE